MAQSSTREPALSNDDASRPSPAKRRNSFLEPVSLLEKVASLGKKISEAVSNSSNTGYAGHKIDHISEGINSSQGVGMQPSPEQGHESLPNLANTGRRVSFFGLDRHDTSSKRASKVETEKLKNNARSREGENLVAQLQPEEQQPHASEPNATRSEDLSNELRKCQEELQKAKEGYSTLIQKLEQSKDEIGQLKRKNLRLLAEKKAPGNHSEAQKACEAITKQLEQLPDADHSKFKDLILQLKFQLAEMLIFQEKFSEAEPIAREALKERTKSFKGSDDYKLSHRQVRKTLLGQRSDDEEVKRMLRIAWAENVECDDWKLQIGDELSSMLVCCEIEDAVSMQKKVLNERKNRYAKQSGSLADIVKTGFRLVETLETKRKQSDAEDGVFWEKQRVQIFEELWYYWRAGLPEEVVGNLLIAGYEVGQHYCKQDWNRAEAVLTVVRDGMRSIDSHIEQLSNVKVLRALASVYCDDRVKDDTRAESVLKELYQELKVSPDFGPGDELTLRYGYQLSTLIERQPGRTLEAGVVMKSVFDMREEALSRGTPVTRELLDTALSYGRLLRKLAQDTTTGRTVLGDRSTLFHLAERAFGLVWNKRTDNAKLDNALDGAQILEAGHSLVTCFVEHYKCDCSDARNQGYEIWTFQRLQGQPRQDTLDFGYHLGACLKDLGSVGTDEVAARILQDIWASGQPGNNGAKGTIRRNLRYGNALGVCLSRLGRFEEARGVLAEVWEEHEQLPASATNDTSDCAYNYGCCLLELGDFSKAHEVLTNATFPLEDARTKPLQHVLEKAQKALDMDGDRDDAQRNCTIAQQRANGLERERDKIEAKYKTLKKQKKNQRHGWFRG